MRRGYGSKENENMSFLEFSAVYIISMLVIIIYTYLASSYGWHKGTDTVKVLCYVAFIPIVNGVVVCLGMLVGIVTGIILLALKVFSFLGDGFYHMLYQ